MFIWICYFLTLLLGVGAGITTSLLGKNLTLYYPNKKGLIVSLFGMALILVAGLFLLIGEKIISPTGETLGENEEVYKPETAERTYLYFMLGFFTIPIGDIIFLLFAHEYKKPIESDLIIPENNNENENIINDNDKKEEQKENHPELINDVMRNAPNFKLLMSTRIKNLNNISEIWDNARNKTDSFDYINDL